MNVSAVMSAPVVTVAAGTTIAEVARRTDVHGVGSVVVTEGEKLLGIVTDRDITVRATAEGLGGEEPVRAVMSTPVVTVGALDGIHEAYRVLRRSGVRRLPVVDGWRVIGMLTVDDLLIDVFQRLADVLGPVAWSVLQEPPGPWGFGGPAHAGGAGSPTTSRGC